MSSTILNLTQRSPIDGTEWAVLATAGANWKAQLGGQVWTFQGLSANGGVASTSTTTGDIVVTGGVGVGGSINLGGGVFSSETIASGAGNSFVITQSQPNSSDTNDAAVHMLWTLSAASATNELVSRVFDLSITNNLTGGGHLQNARVVSLTSNEVTGTTIDTLAMVWIQDNGGGGTVTTGVGIDISSLAGTTKWGFFDNSGANEFTAGAWGVGTQSVGAAGTVYTNAASPMIGTRTSYTNGAGTGTGVTFTNAPGTSAVTGNPTKWIPIDDNGTTRYIPAF